MSEQQGRTVTQRVRDAVTYVALSAMLGPFLLYDPPLVGGYARREWLAIGIGMAAWWLVLEGIFGIPSALMEAVYP